MAYEIFKPLEPFIAQGKKITKHEIRGEGTEVPRYLVDRQCRQKRPVRSLVPDRILA